MNDQAKYGLLLNQHDINLQRQYFIEMTQLLGIQVIFRAPKPDTKNFDLYGEMFSNYEDPVLVGCIFEEHPDQKTTKKLGWNAELQTDASIIHLPYDLPGLQRNALVIVPGALDRSKGRVFKIVDMSTIMIYPASIACQIVPEYENTFQVNELDHNQNNFNLLNDEEEDD